MDIQTGPGWGPLIWSAASFLELLSRRRPIKPVILKLAVGQYWKADCYVWTSVLKDRAESFFMV